MTCCSALRIPDTGVMRQSSTPKSRNGRFQSGASVIGVMSRHSQCPRTAITDSRSFARIAGYFYSKNETGGATGDIFAQIMIGDQGNGKLEAFWEVQEMLTDDTRTWSIIGSGTISDFDTSQISPPYKVKISYDGNKTFSFAVNEIYVDSFTGPIKKRASVASWKGISTL